MRRMLTTLGTLAGAVLLTVSLPASSASAAEGVLIINNVPYGNPAPGCYFAGGADVVRVYNHTDVPVVVHVGPDCNGPVTAFIPPGGAVEDYGRSVRVL